MPQTGRYHRKTAVEILVVMRHLYHGMYCKGVTKVMNPGSVMIANIRNAAFGQKFTKTTIDRLCIAISAVAFNKEKTVRGTDTADRHSVAIGYIL